MKKLLKKKVSIFGKEVSLMLLLVVGFAALGTAALVPYLSNSILGTIVVDSPLSLVLNPLTSEGIVIDQNQKAYTVNVVGGESFIVGTTLEVLSAEPITGHLIEMRVDDFDGEGFIVDYTDNLGTNLLDIEACAPDIPDGNAYYYIAEPAELPAETIIEGETTIETALNIQPNTYEAETRVILGSERACTAE
ncbi:hypothetical protein HY450_00310 [Candidatus Pacearchaeota archaeon]|nr:hypothetical protein [Candidatus Pacearchaeota archaeon]